jgi:hypothetical protein
VENAQWPPGHCPEDREELAVRVPTVEDDGLLELNGEIEKGLEDDALLSERRTRLVAVSVEPNLADRHDGRMNRELSISVDVERSINDVGRVVANRRKDPTGVISRQCQGLFTRSKVRARRDNRCDAYRLRSGDHLAVVAFEGMKIQMTVRVNHGRRGKSGRASSVFI